MTTELLTALALVLMIEGVMPGIFPAAWRKALRSLAEMDDRNIRWIGLGSMLAGAVLLSFLR
ncbi:MAG: DUF2065 domain-containing protein [Xanthomonadales bacterium]|nr:DUF2065 domain-containing protein [Xanthomonadales bacterium]